MTSILSLHKTFPKVTFPTETHNEIYEGRQFKLSSIDTINTKSDLNSTFNLGVYSLSPLINNDNILAPIDPLCLSTLLSILFKENLKLPSLNDQLLKSEKEFSNNFSNFNTISILSYQSSVDNQLPILIEDSKDKINHKILRKIRYTNLINLLNSSNLDLNDSLIFDLINTQLFDFFNLSILNLTNLDLLYYYSIFNYNFQNLTPLTILPISKFLSSNLRLNLLKRNNFNVRNPSVFNYLSSYLTLESSKSAYIYESNKIIKNAKILLKLLDNSLNNSKFWSNTGSPSIIDFQIASYVYAMNYLSILLPTFKEILSENNNLLSHSTSILSLFI